MQLSILGHTLDRLEAASLGLDGEHRAALDCHAVDQDGARAALARVAADVCAREADHIAQVMHEQEPWLDLMLVLVPVDCRRDLVLHALSPLNPPRGRRRPGPYGSTRRAEDEPDYCATFSDEMQLINSFTVGAPPDRVFAYLLDVTKVVGCVPGAELTEVVDPTTFKGKVKVKVGPITVAYSGTARIVDRNDAQRSATLEGDGRETTGPGSARAKAVMSVEADGAGSTIKIVTDYTVAGRVAQFGRGVMEDVSKRLVAEMAACIKANVEAAEPGPGLDSGSSSGTDGGGSEGGPYAAAHRL